VKTLRLALALSLVLPLAGCPSTGGEEPATEPDGFRTQGEDQDLRAELFELGPSPEERLENIAVDAAEEAEIKRKILAFRYIARGKASQATRTNRRNILIEEHGVKAVPFLIQNGLGDAAYWRQRVSAQALEILCGDPSEGADARWLCYHFNAPEKAIAMFGTGPKTESVALAKDVNGALSAITGMGHETDVAWRSAWNKEHDRWKKEELRRNQRRGALRQELGISEQAGRAR
jgi:hypothetical protein